MKALKQELLEIKIHLTKQKYKIKYILGFNLIFV